MDLAKIYYSVDGYWKGYSAVPKLAKKAGVSESVAKSWLEKQAMWQIYLPPPKYIPRPHWVIDKPNEIHQADLLFLPHDTVGRKTYKYALVVVDVASRYKDAEAITSKESYEVSKAFKKIYSKKPSRLRWPKRLMVDPGKEFMGSVTTLMKSKRVIIQRGEAGNHKSQAFAENANKIIAEKLFSHQYAQEILMNPEDPQFRSRVWVKRLPDILKSLNSEPMRITGKEPVDAIEKDEVNITSRKYKRAVGFNEVRLPPEVEVRYLLAPGEDEGGERRRATDPIWSLDVYNLLRSVVSSDQPVLYYLENGPKRGMVREELQVIPYDTMLPPKDVL